MKILFSLFLLALSHLFCVNASAAVADVKVGGWFEGGYVTWTKVAGQIYNVYVQSTSATEWTKLDDELVREYPTYGRADALGLKAGSYRFKVVPVDKSTKAELADEATVTDSFIATAYDRGGFAHFKTASSTFNPANGVGAYKNDGTLKDGAKVIYVYADNAKNVTTKVKTGSKTTDITECVGFQNILDAYEKGQDKTPIDFRIVGTIKAENMDGFSSSAEGVQIKGRNSYSELNITIEGVGKDAAVHGFGFLIRNAASVEFRNFAIMWCMDDAVSMDTDNSNLWMHNLDLFYGKPGSAADQKKGDGTLDIKGDSKYSTLSYNHLWDSGKSSLCGMKSESGPNYLTYHHNWFDHSDSRHPRIRTMTVHVYNNYYDGNSKYGIGATTGADVFAENNYFRNCKYPMLSSKQGSDVHNGIGSSDDTKGTFSGENGGSIKAFGNYMTGHKSFEPYDAADATYSKHFDAYVASTREEKVPASMVALLGGDTYSNFDTNADLMYTGYKVDEAKDVPAVVKGELGAGRCQHGDFTWAFGANEDTNDKVIASLSTAIQNYKSTLVGFFNKAISNGGASGEQGGSSDEGNGGSGDNTGGGDDGGDDNTIVEEPYITGATADDYFLFNEENADKVKAYLADGTIALQNGNDSTSVSKFDPKYSYDAAAAGKTFASTIYTGSLQLGKASSAGKTDGGAVVFRCNKGVTTFAAHMYRTGSVYLNVYTSTDSVKWTKVATVEKGTSGIYEKNFSSAVMDTTHCVFIKVENTSTGGLNIQGVRILNLEGATVKGKTEPSTDPDDTGGEQGDPGKGDVSDALYKFTVKAIVPAAVKDGVAQNYSDPIETTGGKFIFGNVSKIAASTVSSTGFDYKMDGNASATNTKYVKIILNDALKLGDKISVTGSQTAGTPSATKVIGYSIYTDQAAAPLATLLHTKKGAEETITMDVTEAMVGLKEFMLVRYTGASVFFSGIEITGEKPAAKSGDVNGDGSVSVADLALIASYILGENVEGFNTKVADVNGDETVTVADLALIASMILGGNGDADNNNGNANTTEKGIVAQGLEMPRVAKGNNYLLLSKYDDNGNLNYTVEWDCIERAQRWTCWVWTKSNSNKNWDRSKWKSGETFNGFGGTEYPFQPDKEVDAAYRSELKDYSSSGYNRGHICDSEDRIYSKTANGQTFFLTNMHPQIYDFNGYVWASMESKVRNWRDATVNAGGTMYICKGGTIGDVVLNGKTQSGVIERISGSSKYEINSTSGIPVPKYFFMAVLKCTSGGTYSAMAFWAEHKYDHSTNLAPYMISIDELEARTGYDFFCNLPDKLENSVESIQPQISEWK